MTSEAAEPSDSRAAPPSRPAVLRVVGPPGSGKTLLIVALTAALRARGVRVGAVEGREALDGTMATVLTLGSGARVTLAGALSIEVVAARAAALDPALDLLLAEGFAGPGVPAIEVLESEAAQPATPPGDLVGRVTRERLAAAFASSGPTDDLGLAALIEARVLHGGAAPSALARATEAPIESSRRLLDRGHTPTPEPPSDPPPRPRRGWLRRLRRG